MTVGKICATTSGVTVGVAVSSAGDVGDGGGVRAATRVGLAVGEPVGCSTGVAVGSSSVSEPGNPHARLITPKITQICQRLTISALFSLNSRGVLYTGQSPRANLGNWFDPAPVKSVGSFFERAAIVST